jgi:hypothetical protein
MIQTALTTPTAEETAAAPEAKIEAKLNQMSDAMLAAIIDGTRTGLAETRDERLIVRWAAVRVFEQRYPELVERYFLRADAEDRKVSGAGLLAAVGGGW